MIKHKIPLFKENDSTLVHTFINGIKRTFIIDLNREETLLNSAYFYSNAKTGQPYTIHKLNLYGLKPEIKTFKIENLSQYEKDGRAIHGIFGLDIIKGFTYNLSPDKLELSVS